MTDVLVVPSMSYSGPFWNTFLEGGQVRGEAAPGLCLPTAETPAHPGGREGRDLVCPTRLSAPSIHTGLSSPPGRLPRHSPAAPAAQPAKVMLAPPEPAQACRSRGLILSLPEWNGPERTLPDVRYKKSERIAQ